MDRFAEEFTNELVDPIWREPVHSWNALAIAAPERHLANSREYNMPIAAVAYQLQQNDAFNKLSTVLDIQFNTKTITYIADEIDDNAEQVWLFAWDWFNKYVTYLLDALTMRSTFYKTRHTQFINIMRCMLSPVAADRISFKTAIKMWDPSLITESSSESSLQSSLPSSVSSSESSLPF